MIFEVSLNTQVAASQRAWDEAFCIHRVNTIQAWAGKRIRVQSWSRSRWIAGAQRVVAELSPDGRRDLLRVPKILERGPGRRDRPVPRARDEMADVLVDAEGAKLSTFPQRTE
jgi:hypothetical protein